jgi:hypothetical protein
LKKKGGESNALGFGWGKDFLGFLLTGMLKRARLCGRKKQ